MKMNLFTRKQKMDKTATYTYLSEEDLEETLKLLRQHADAIAKSNDELRSEFELRENALLRVTSGGYIISEKLAAMKRETHNLFASIQIIAEATEVAFSALEEQKRDWEIRYANLETATTGFTKIIEIISKSIESLRELGERIKDIEVAIDRIHNISHLTRGVSRNAGIKAFHAGEKGKGFEVIARELTQLTKESLNITVEVPEMIQRFRTKTNEAVNFIAELTHNMEQVKQNAEDMKLKLKSSENLLGEFMDVSNIIHTAVDKQLGIKNKLGEEEEIIAAFATQSLIETGNLTTLEQSQNSLSLLVNRFVENMLLLLGSLEQKEKSTFNAHTGLIIINTNKLKDYMVKVSSLTSQIRESSLEATKHFESQKEKMVQILSIIEDNKQIKQEIAQETDSLMNILQEVADLFNETNTLSENILTIIDRMTALVERADSYFSSLEKEMQWVGEILKKLKLFSKRSNLLSLYASIESARAFEFKKNLDVIVTQIKDLSKQSSGALKTIEDSVNKAKLSLKNVHQIMYDTSGKLRESKNDFKPITTGFQAMNISTRKLNELVDEMMRTLDRQTVLEETLSSLENFLSSKIEDNIHQSIALVRETEKMGSVVSKLKYELGELEKKLLPLVPADQTTSRTILRLRLTGDIMDTDPSRTTDSSSHRVAVNVFKGLVEQGPDANVIPAIAKRWKLSKDGLIWNFALRDDVKFHDGDLLTAYDVKSTLKHILSGPHKYMFDMIRGANEFARRRTKDIEGIKIMDNHHLSIELSHPYIPFLKNLFVSCSGIAKQTDKGLVGAGPYMLKSWEKGKEIVLESFDDYFGKRPFFDEIHFVVCHDDTQTTERFLNREFDIINIPGSVDITTFTGTEESALFRIEPFLIYDIYYIGINVRLKTPFQNKLVRQAVNFALDRNEYIQKVTKGRGTPARGIFPPNFPSYNKTLTGYEHNPEKAKALLVEAGFPNGLPGEYQFDIRDSKIATIGGEIIRKSLERVGIRVKLNLLSWEELLSSAHKGKSLLFALGWSNDNADPDSFLYPLFHSKNWGEPGNTAFYKNETVDALLDEAATLTDNYKRTLLYQQVEEILVDDAPWIFLYHSQHYTAMQQYIQGYTKNPLTTERLEDVWKLSID